MALPGKLWKLKQWLTVPEAARHLSIMFGEDVCEANVLRLALDGHLKLSVNFVNGVEAKGGQVVTTETLWGEIQGELSPHRSLDGANALVKAKDAIVCWLESQYPEGKMVFGEKMTNLDGVCDLYMDGNVRYDIEHKYQQLTDGPAVTLQSMKNVVVARPDGKIFQLQQRVDDEYLEELYGEEGIKRRVDYYAECLKKQISDNEIDEAEAEKLLEQRKKNLSRKRDPSDDYFPAGGLPSDSVLVVRTSALTDLQARLEKENEAEANGKATVKDEIGAKRGTWLKIIYLLAARLANTNPTAYKKKNGSFNFSQFEDVLKDIAGDLWGNEDGSTANKSHGLSNDNLKIIFDEAKKLF